MCTYGSSVHVYTRYTAAMCTRGTHIHCCHISTNMLPCCIDAFAICSLGLSPNQSICAALPSGLLVHWVNYVSISFHIINPLNVIVLWCTEGFRGALNWAPLMPRDASLSDSYKSDRWRFSCLAVFLHWENYISISFHIEWDMIVVTVFL